MASSPINAFWHQQQTAAKQNQHQHQSFTQNYYNPNQQLMVVPASAASNENGGAAIQMASVNPQLFLQGFRLRVCPTKPVPWDDVRALDFNALRLSPPELDRMRDMTLQLVDAQFDANTIFGEVTVATRDGGHIVKPAPSVADVVSLCRSLQAVLQFNLHSISALRDQVRKQTVINQNFESELKRITTEHVNQVSASSRAKESQITFLEDRVAKLVAENTRLRETLVSSDSKVKELRIETSSAELAWKEERAKLQDENFALRQFIGGHTGGLDAGSRKNLFENILNGDGNLVSSSSRDTDRKKSSSSNHKHRSSSSSKHNHHQHRDKKHRHHSSSRGGEKHCDSVSCHKCGRGSLRPIPFAIVNQQLPEGQTSALAPPRSEPATKPKEPSASSNKNDSENNNKNQQQETLLPYQAPSTLEQLRMQESIDQNRKQTENSFNKLESIVRTQGDEFRTSVKMVGDVAQRSMQMANEADARQRQSNDHITDAVSKLRQSQQESETRVLGVLNQNDQQIRDHINRVGDKLKSETREVVTEQVGALSKRVDAIEGEVAGLKNAPPPPKHISIALKESTNAEYPQQPPHQHVSPSRLPRQQVNHHNQVAANENQEPVQQQQQQQQAAEEPIQYVHHERKLQSPPKEDQQLNEDTIDPKLVVMSLNKKSHNDDSEAEELNNNNKTTNQSNVQVSLLSLDHAAAGVTRQQPQTPTNASSSKNSSPSPSSSRKMSPKFNDDDQSTQLSTTDPNDSFQARHRAKRTARKEAERMTRVAENIRDEEKLAINKRKVSEDDDGGAPDLNTEDIDGDVEKYRHDGGGDKNQRQGNNSGGLFPQSSNNNMPNSGLLRDPDDDHLVDDGFLATPHLKSSSAINNVGGPGGSPSNANNTSVTFENKAKKDDDDDVDEFGETKITPASATTMPKKSASSKELEKLRQQLKDLGADDEDYY